MGTSRSAAELAGKIDAYATILPRANRQAVEQVALFAKDEFIRGAVAAGLRRGGALPKASGARWGARYDVKGAKNPTALVRYVGPVHWAFAGTEPHVIVASGLAGRARARRLQRGIGARSAFGGSNRGAFRASAAALAAMDERSAARGRRVRARKRALRTPDGLRAYAFHPGHRGRNTWPATKRRIAERSPAVFSEAHRNALLRSFGP